MKKPIGLLVLFFSGMAGLFADAIDNMAPGTWYTVPNSAMRQVAPTYGQFAGTWATSGPSAVIAAWGGGVFDTQRDRLVLWGGGHGDYYGNEIYVFDVPTFKWIRLTDPTVNPTLPGPNWDGTPSSRHSYNQLAYVEHADVMFNMGGGTCGCGTPAQFSEGRTWAFDFAQKKWTNTNPASEGPGSVYAMTCAYDPASKKVWYGHESNGLWDFDYDQKKWTKHNSQNGFYYYTSVIDTKRGLFVQVGSGNVYAYDIRNNNFTRQTWATTGGASFISKSNVGLAYDSAADRIVGWAGGDVYVLNPDTKVWTAYAASGAPSQGQNGIFGRWRYIPSRNVFIVVTGIDNNVAFYKLPAGAGTSAETGAVQKKPAASAEPRSFVYDIRGRRVAATQGELRTEGWPAGIYIVRSVLGDQTTIRRMVVRN